MRKIILSLAVPVLLVSGCGKDETVEPPPPMDISVIVSPDRVIMDLGEARLFTAFVYGTSNRNVTWLVQDIPGGNSEFGTIDSSGHYGAPITEPNVDSLKITARSDADTSKSGNAWVVIVDPDKIYVSESGSDTEGDGSKLHPYRSMTYALTQAVSQMSVVVRPGTYDLSSGEEFPISVPSGVTVTGAGSDSTFVTGPGGSNDQQGAVFYLNGAAITLEKLNISTTSVNGVGIWMLPAMWVIVRSNFIGPNFTGIAVTGDSLPLPLIIDSNVISGDTIGVSTDQFSRPTLRGNSITDCSSIGVYILGSSRPDLGINDTTGAGDNTIQNCGPNDHWLVRNESPDTIKAIGNIWELPIPSDNDQFIYDDEESGGVSGPVLLENQ